MHEESYKHYAYSTRIVSGCAYSVEMHTKIKIEVGRITLRSERDKDVRCTDLSDCELIRCDGAKKRRSRPWRVACRE